jgi:hypothetical protein
LFISKQKNSLAAFRRIPFRWLEAFLKKFAEKYFSTRFTLIPQEIHFHPVNIDEE